MHIDVTFAQLHLDENTQKVCVCGGGGGGGRHVHSDVLDRGFMPLQWRSRGGQEGLCRIQPGIMT